MIGLPYGYLAPAGSNRRAMQCLAICSSGPILFEAALKSCLLLQLHSAAQFLGCPVQAMRIPPQRKGAVGKNILQARVAISGCSTVRLKGPRCLLLVSTGEFAKRVARDCAVACTGNAQMPCTSAVYRMHCFVTPAGIGPTGAWLCTAGSCMTTVCRAADGAAMGPAALSSLSQKWPCGTLRRGVGVCSVTTWLGLVQRSTSASTSSPSPCSVGKLVCEEGIPEWMHAGERTLSSILFSRIALHKKFTGKEQGCGQPNTRQHCTMPLDSKALCRYRHASVTHNAMGLCTGYHLKVL